VAFSLPAALSICHGVASALAYLHGLGIAHSDVYAHNIMFDDHARPVICDFGASFCYSADADAERFFERMEVRAYGLFMHDVVARIVGESGAADGVVVQQQLQQLVQQCLVGSAMQRPLFALLEQQLLSLMQQQGVAVPAGDDDA
jgi:RIO-like serine/threonine protein kinase